MKCSHASPGTGLACSVSFKRGNRLARACLCAEESNGGVEAIHDAWYRNDEPRERGPEQRSGSDIS